MRKTSQSLVLLFVCCFVMANSWAKSGEKALREEQIEHELSNLQNGVRVFTNLCVLCHDLKYVKFQDLAEIGMPIENIDEIRGVNNIGDPMLSKMNAQQMHALFGMLTPDLSLMAKARGNGIQYIYSLLLAYDERGDGSIVNILYPNIKMPDVLAYSITNDASTRSRLEQDARDVVAFLAWTADPRAQERRSLGVYVMLYLFVLTFMLYLVKRKTWARLKS